MYRFIIPALLVLAVPGAAQAHVTIQPQELTAGAFKRIDVRVPNERDNKGTSKVQVQMPPGVASASYEPEPGWSVKIERRKRDTPIDVHGTPVDDEVATVTFTAEGDEGVIRPGEFRDFGLSIRVPDGNAGDKIVFKSLQTYEDGEVVRWINDPEAEEEPAPQVTLLAADGGHGAASATEAEAEAGAAPAAGGDGDEGGTDTLSVVALIVGGLGLLAGVAGLMAARRRPAVA